MCLTALSLVGLSSVLALQSDDDSATGKEAVSLFELCVGISLIILGQVVCASQYVLEEWLLSPPNTADPLLIVGLEGFWGGLVMLACVLPMCQFVLPGKDVGGVYENSYASVAAIEGNSLVQKCIGVFLCFVFTRLFYCDFCVPISISRFSNSTMYFSRTPRCKPFEMLISAIVREPVHGCSRMRACPGVPNKKPVDFVERRVKGRGAHEELSRLVN